MRELKNLDWEHLGFIYRPCEKRYVAEYKNGAWSEGGLSDDPEVRINECAGILQYCQECFEGLKAYECGAYVQFCRVSLHAALPQGALPGCP